MDKMGCDTKTKMNLISCCHGRCTKLYTLFFQNAVPLTIREKNTGNNGNG